MEFIHRALHVAEKKHIAKPNAFLEDAAGTHASTVSRWKRGEGVMSLEQAAGIARALGVSVSVDYLLGGEEAGARVGGLLTEEQKHILALVEALGLDGNEAMRRLAVSTVYRIGDAIPGEVRVIAERTQTMKYQPPRNPAGSERDVPGQIEQE